jgi:aldehyde dehydrogenase (NAD+)
VTSTELALPNTRAHYIGGRWTNPIGTRTIDVVNPTTEEVLTSVPAATVDDVDAAVTAAHMAAPDWAASSAARRADVLDAIADGIDRHASLLTDLITADLGMPAKLASRIQVGLPATDFRNYAQAVRDFEWERRIGHSTVRSIPVGVVGAITPWNFPLHQIAGKVGAALAAGCTVVLKPSEVTPLAAFVLAQIIAEIGLPPGVFNMVVGDAEAGASLVGHSLVDIVSFTGSTASGAVVAAEAGRRLRPVTLELGGKSPALLLPGLGDDELEAACRAVLANGLLNSGQTCNALTRIVVHSGERRAVEEHLRSHVQRFTLGDPTDPATRIGPLVSGAQRERVAGHVQRAIADGASLLAGGHPAEVNGSGYFYEPTVLVDVTDDMPIAQQEVFGPVLVVQDYDDLDDGIRVANATPYGLSAAVFGPDAAAAREVAWRIRAGQVDVNAAPFNPSAPFGGFKDSGFGREFGSWGIEEFLAPQSVQSS